MSAVSSLLRRRSLRVLESLLKNRPSGLEYLTAISSEGQYGVRNFATSDRRAQALSPRPLLQNRKFIGGSSDFHRKFATDAQSPPQSTGGTIEQGAKIAAVAVTVAALTWAATYWYSEGKPPQLSDITKYFSTEEQRGQSFEVKDKTARQSQVPESYVIGHQSDQEDVGKSRATEAASEVPEVKPKVIEDSNVMLEVIKGVPLKPKAIEDFELEPHGITESDFQVKEVEDVESSPHMTEGISRKFQGSDDTEEWQQSVQDSTTAGIKGDESTTTMALDVEEEGAQSHLYETVTEVNVENVGSDGSSHQPDFPVSTDGQLLVGTDIEDLEPDAFRKELQDSAKQEDLKELSDKILYNQTSGNEAHGARDETYSRDAADNLRGVVAETVEAVTDLAEALHKAALQPDGSQGVQGLADAYFLKEKIADSTGEEDVSDQPYYAYAGAIEEVERRQAESDAQFREMLLKLDEEYQQELREARKQQELQAQYASKLEKDLSIEKARWQEQARQQLRVAEERLRNELKRKEDEAKKVLEKMELLTQARTSAAVAAEKARQLKEIKDLQIQIEALHKAYSAQSEGAKVSHTTHKLAMGAFALEDAMARGAPLEEEVELLRQAAGGDDELIDVALQSLPNEILTKGTKTPIQLQREFASLQGPLRQLALIPAGQGGLLTHVVASAVAVMKVRESSGREGVESVIATVDKCLINGQLSQAASILEQGVKGTRAETFVADWARHARRRVIAEQALTLVQSHAIATAAGLA